MTSLEEEINQSRTGNQRSDNNRRKDPDKKQHKIPKENNILWREYNLRSNAFGSQM